MTDQKRGYGGVSGAAKDALIAGLREASRNRKARPEGAPAPQAKPARIVAYDFSQIEDYKQLRIQRAAGQMMGIDNPFFRSHDGLAGATTMIDGRSYLNFASYNYLGFNGHPQVNQAAEEAIARYGTSVSASRLVAGERPIHRAFEKALAAYHRTEDAVVFVSGHATNVSTIGTLLGPKDLLLMDALIHNSVAEGARLSGAARLTFPHNDWQAVRDLLSKVRGQYQNVLIVVEGLYSMDGDFPDLPRFIEAKSDFNAWLMVDEAHSLGVLGEHGGGIAEHFGIDPQSVEMWMGTLSKTLSGCGGYIAGSAALVDYLKVRAGGFVYSVGLSAPLAAAGLASLRLLAEENWRVEKLQRNGRHFLDTARAAGLDTGLSRGYAVVPILVGDSPQAAVLADRVFKRGLNALPIIYPAVPEKSARLRFFITSDHSFEQIDEAIAITAEELDGVRKAGSVLKQLVGR